MLSVGILFSYDVEICLLLRYNQYNLRRQGHIQTSERGHIQTSERGHIQTSERGHIEDR
jgi:hypothetical protein